MRPLRLSLIAFAATLPMSAYAQSTTASAQAAQAAKNSANSANVLGEVVVTAQFREQRLQDTPLAITAVNAATLAARGQTSVYEIAAQAPNVTLEPAAQSYGSGLVAFIRGIGQYDNSYALEPGVGIYVDDVYYSTLTGSLLDLLDLSRVEVLRGPQGTLAGKNSIGGAIKLYSKLPDGNDSGSIQATYGSFNRTEVRGSGNVTLIPDKLFLRISGDGKSQDGYVKRLDYGATHPGSGVPTFESGPSPVLGTLGGISYVAGRAALRWLPTSNVEVNLATDYTNDRSEAGAAVLLYANPSSGTNADGQPWVTNTNTGAAVPYDCHFVPYGSNSCDTIKGYNRKYITYSNFLDPTPATSQSPFKPVSFNPINYLKAYGGQGTVDWTLAPNLKLKSITGYRHYENDYAHDEDGSPLPVEQLDYQLKHSQFSEEVRLNADLLGGKLNTTVGGFYFESDSSTSARVDLNYTGLDFLDGPDKIHVLDEAAFGQAIYHITDALNLTGGVRYTYDSKSYAFSRSNPDGAIPSTCAFFLGAPTAGPTGIGNSPNCLIAGLNGATDSARGNRLDYRVALDYRLNRNLLGYADISTGFKGGGINPYPYYGPDSPYNQVKSFGPESVTAYEVGVKSDFLDRRARVNIAAFYNQYKNIILSLSACPVTPCDEPSNIGSADVKGVEVEGQLRPVTGLSFDAAFSYLDFKYTSLNTLAQVSINDVTPYTPKIKWSVGAQYDYDFAPGRLSGRIDGSYQDSVFGNPVNAESNKIPQYFVSNGRLFFTTSNKTWQMALEIKNIFDKYYYLSLVQESQYVSATPAMPRTFAVTVTRNF